MPVAEVEVRTETAPVVDDLQTEQQQVQAQHQQDKNRMLEWLVEQDFCRDFNLFELSEQPFEMDDQEALLQPHAVAKILKLLCYKVGLAFKRQDLMQTACHELVAEAATHSQKQITQVRSEFEARLYENATEQPWDELVSLVALNTEFCNLQLSQGQSKHRSVSLSESRLQEMLHLINQKTSQIFASR